MAAANKLVAAELDLTARLVDALAHLRRLQPGEVVDMGVRQRRRFGQDHCALSLGVTLAHVDDDAPAALLSRGYSALYAATQLGKDRVAVLP